jgi:acetyl esterase/lipase
MGDSAGGGVAAALTILARERGGPKIARQILLMPMLDDRTTTPDPHIAPYALWSYDDSLTAWPALLGDAAGGPDVPATAAPARLEDATGLPAAYIEVGQLDPHRDPALRPRAGPGMGPAAPTADAPHRLGHPRRQPAHHRRHCDPA